MTARCSSILTQLKADISKYQKKLDDWRLKDQDLTLDVKETPVATLAFERLAFLLVLLPVATPGLLVNLPFYLLGTAVLMNRH